MEVDTHIICGRVSQLTDISLYLNGFLQKVEVEKKQFELKEIEKTYAEGAKLIMTEDDYIINYTDFKSKNVVVQTI